MNESLQLPTATIVACFWREASTSRTKAGACATRVRYSNFQTRCDRERDVLSPSLFVLKLLNGSIEDTPHFLL